MRTSEWLRQRIALAAIPLALGVTTALSGCMAMHAHEVTPGQTEAQAQLPADHGAEHAAEKTAAAESHTKSGFHGHGMMEEPSVWAWVGGAVMVAMMLLMML